VNTRDKNKNSRILHAHKNNSSPHTSGNWCCPSKSLNSFGITHESAIRRAQDKMRSVNQSLVSIRQILTNTIPFSFLHPEKISRHKKRVFPYALACSRALISPKTRFVQHTFTCYTSPVKFSFYSEEKYEMRQALYNGPTQSNHFARRGRSWNHEGHGGEINGVQHRAGIGRGPLRAPLILPFPHYRFQRICPHRPDQSLRPRRGMVWCPWNHTHPLQK